MGVPLPGTGAWTGAAMGAMFNLSTRDTIVGTVLGIVSAAMIMTALVLAGTACVVKVADRPWVSWQMHVVSLGLPPPPMASDAHMCRKAAAIRMAPCT